MDDMSEVDEFINQCLIDFMNGGYEYDYGEDIADGGLKVMLRSGADYSIYIQSSRSHHFAMYVIYDNSCYFYYACIGSEVEPFHYSGPIEKFKDNINSLIVLHALEAI